MPKLLTKTCCSRVEKVFKEHLLYHQPFNYKLVHAILLSDATGNMNRSMDDCILTTIPQFPDINLNKKQ